VVERVRPPARRRYRPHLETPQTRNSSKRGVRHLSRDVHHPAAFTNYIMSLTPWCRYYEGGVSSVYLWDLDDGGFAGVVLLKKSEPDSILSIPSHYAFHPAMAPATPSEPSGSWDSIHVFETAERGRQAHYKLTSTIMLQLITRRRSSDDESPPQTQQQHQHKQGNPELWTGEGEVTLSGSMTRQVRSFVFDPVVGMLMRFRWGGTKTEQDSPLQDSSSHISNMGRMIEDQEIKMRNLLQEVYFGKTRDIVYDLRSVEDLEKARRQRDLQRELVGSLKR
jgi:capping protein (actin filament) muscle Z-line, beta